MTVFEIIDAPADAVRDPTPGVYWNGCRVPKRSEVAVERGNVTRNA